MPKRRKLSEIEAALHPRNIYREYAHVQAKCVFRCRECDALLEGAREADLHACPTRQELVDQHAAANMPSPQQLQVCL